MFPPALVGRLLWYCFCQVVIPDKSKRIIAGNHVVGIAKSQFLTMAVKGVPRVDNDFNLRPRFNIREQCLVKIWADRQDFTGCLYILSLIGVWDVNASDRKSTRLNSSHVKISYAVFCLKN